MSQIPIEESFRIAVGHHQNGRLSQAENLYKQILIQQPNHAGALQYLGVIAYQKGQNDVAVDLIRRAIVLQPGNADAYNNLGAALKEAGQLDESIASCRHAIALNSKSPEAHNNLGNALRENGQLDEAIVACRHAIALKADYAEAYNNLGSALRDKEQLEDAIAAYHRAIAINANLPKVYRNLGDALRDKGQLLEAVAAYQQAIALRPNFPEAHNNLGTALRELGQLDAALAACRRAIALKPVYPQAYANLGNSLRDSGKADDAIAAFRHAIILKSDQPMVYNNLGNALRDLGQLDEAIAAYRQAIALDPSYHQAHSNLIYSLYFHPGFSAREIAREQAYWNRQHAEPLRRFIVSHTNNPDPDRRLRVGYVSPDFREHSAARFLLPLLAHHDKSRVEIFAYAQVLVPDARTMCLRNHVDGWRNIVGLSDANVADLIRRDGIDILVDLTMHMAHGRPLVFARKPAPVQVAWLAYPGSTGLTAVDYRLSDPYLDPPESDDTVYSEQTIRLPDSFWCYDPADGRDIPINALPATANGFVTFGCLNNFSKINSALLRHWAQVLGPTNGARLLLLTDSGSHTQRVTDELSHEGIDPTRVEFLPRQSRQDYLKLYHRIDLGLDSLPYNGHTTSLDSLWMGVPVVSLAGKTAVGRAGVTILSNLGLQELIARSDEEYVRIATDLARDLPRLSALRSTLRRRMEQSPLMDAPCFARNIEAAHRQMWQKWCATSALRS